MLPWKADERTFGSDERIDISNDEFVHQGVVDEPESGTK